MRGGEGEVRKTADTLQVSGEAGSHLGALFSGHFLGVHRNKHPAQ